MALGAAPAAQALQYGLILDGGYLYSRWEYQSTTSTFSLLSKSGTTSGAEISLGGQSFDFIIGGVLNQFTWTAPSTRIITDASSQALSYFGGLRFKNKYIWTTLKYVGKDIVYLEEASTTDFTVKTAPVGFGVLALKLFGWGAGYRITLDGEIGVPAGTGTTALSEKLEVSYYTRGTVRVEFGSNFRVGIMTGIENQEYSVNTSTKYYRSDFFGGLTIAIGAGKSGKGGSGRSYGGSKVPNYPLF